MTLKNGDPASHNGPRPRPHGAVPVLCRIHLGLGGLMSLHPILPGGCATAVSYLYDNLLDLHDAYPGEDWRPLRRLIRQARPPLGRLCPEDDSRCHIRILTAVWP